MSKERAIEIVQERILDLEAKLEAAKAADPVKLIYIEALEAAIERSHRELLLYLR